MRRYPTIPRVCRYCGTSFLAVASLVKRGEGIFCSRDCHNEAQRRDDVVTTADIARFWKKVDRSGGPNACWPWRASTDRKGYGVFRWRGRQRMAPRVAYEIAYGHEPEHFACHHCDSPACCNPTHLFDGTQDDNMRDAAAKGRTALGERNGQAILSAEMVLAIRAEYVRDSRQFGAPALAKKYGMSRRSITNIVSRKSWTHV